MKRLALLFFLLAFTITNTPVNSFTPTPTVPTPTPTVTETPIVIKVLGADSIIIQRVFKR